MKAADETIVFDEGDLCPVCKKGELVYPKVENCSCHNTPPCSACVNNMLECNDCLMDIEEIEKVNMSEGKRVVHKVVKSNGDLHGHFIMCPACKVRHLFGTGWTFNGDYDKPTFSPSMLAKHTQEITDEEHTRIMKGEPFEPVDIVCHSFVTNGEIRFLGDCTHDMKNTTVKLEAYE